MEEKNPYEYTPRTKEMGFLARMKRGFKRVGELKEQWDEKRLQAAEKRFERQEKYAKVYEAEAKMYEAAIKKEAARQKLSRLRMGSFGQQSQQPFGIDMSLKQVQRPQQKINVVYKSPKRKKSRYIEQPQLSIDDQLVAFMRR